MSLSQSTIDALKVALPELIKQAKQRHAETKINSHRERLQNTIRNFILLNATADRNEREWGGNHYQDAREALSLACDYVLADDVDFVAALDEVEKEMRRLNFK